MGPDAYIGFDACTAAFLFLIVGLGAQVIINTLKDVAGAIHRVARAIEKQTKEQKRSRE